MFKSPQRRTSRITHLHLKNGQIGLHSDFVVRVSGLGESVRGRICDVDLEEIGRRRVSLVQRLLFRWNARRRHRHCHNGAGANDERTNEMARVAICELSDLDD